ncbi:hypothetical protein DRO33_00425, partial [Candidatus Bathyarchaeota archaeon]
MGVGSNRWAAFVALVLALLLASWAALPIAHASAGPEAPAPTEEQAEDFALKDAYWSDWLGRGLNNTFSVVLEYLSSPEATSINATLDVSSISPGEGPVED